MSEQANTNSQIQVHQEQTKWDKILIKKIVILTMFYFLVGITFASFSTVAIYIHQKYNHKGYGETYLSANSFSSVLTYIFCPFIIDRAKQRSKLLSVMCVMGYLLNMLIPTIMSYIDDNNLDHTLKEVPPPSTLRYIFEIIANIIGGVSSSVNWVMYGIYMANYCQKIQKNQKGRYFSISNCILNARIVLGPFITMLGLGLGNQTKYFALLSLLVIISLPFPLFCIPSINLRQHEEEKQLKKQQQNELQLIQNANNKQNICKYLLSFIVYFRKIVYIIPYSILPGLVFGFVASSLSHLLPKIQSSFSKDLDVAVALFFFGLGNIVGAYLSGVLCDRYSIKVAGFVVSLIVISGAVLQAILLSITHTVNRASLMGFISGVSFSYLGTYLSIICTIYYKGDSFSFATTKQVTAFSYIGYQWAIAFLNNKCNMKLNMTYQCLALIPIALIAAFCIIRQSKIHEKKQVGQMTGNELKQFQSQINQTKQNKQIATK